MIIESIDYKNVGNKATFTAGFKPGINIITGPNDCGKTTLKNAILYALTGIASDRDKKELHTTNIPNPRSEITLIADGHKIIRQLVPDSVVYYDGIKKKLSKSKDIDALYDVGLDRKTLKMICDNYNFFNLSGEEQQEILFKYFSGNSEINIEDYGVTDANEKLHFFGITASNIPVYYKKFYDMRRDIKKEIEILEITKSNKVNEASALNIHMSLIDLEKHRTELTNKIKSNVVYDKSFSDKIDSLNAEIEALNRNEYVSQFKDKINLLNRTGLANKELIESISKLSGKCPLSPTIECGSAVHLNSIKDTKIAENNKLREEVTALLRQDEQAKIKFNQTKETEIKKLTEEIITARKLLNESRDNTDAINKTINSENSIIFAEIESVDRNISILKHKQSLEREITEIDKQLATKRDMLIKFELYLELTGDGEKSIKNKMVLGNIGDFFKQVTEYSMEFGYEFMQNPSSKEFEILINNKTSNMLSSSGKIKASIAIQVAIAKKSGYNIIMVDDIEKCEQGNLMKIINALTESGVQAFIFGHNLNKAMFPTTCNIIELA